MKNIQISIIMLMLLILCALYFPVLAENDEIMITVEGETGLTVKTMDGVTAEIVTEEGISTAKLPADNVYLLWLTGKEGETQAACNAHINSINWDAEIIELFPDAEKPALVINPPSHFITEDGLIFEKLTVIGQPDAFPAMKINTNTPAGNCTLSIDPAFSIFTANESVLKSNAEMVLTLFPDIDTVSVWIASLDHLEDYMDSRFLLNTKLSCSDGEKTVTALSAHDNMPVLHENGILVFNFSEFLKGYDSFFSGDLDGDDDYETNSGTDYFDLFDLQAKGK